MEQKITKKEIIKILESTGTLLELKGENPFKSRAYFSAARNIQNSDQDIKVLIESGNLSSIKGIGKALTKKITELVTTGKLQYYKNLKASIPSGLIEMLRIPGLGPAKIRTLHDKLQIETVGELEYACIENMLIDLQGFGKKTQEKILAGIQHLKQYQERHLYAEVIDEAKVLLNDILKHEAVKQGSLAGSIRRCNEIIKDIDLVVSTEQPLQVADFFISHQSVSSVTGKGKTKVSLTLKSGINTDLRMVTDEQFPFALHHFTGSKEHNTAMRHRAKQMNLKMNEYGILGPEGHVSCKNESDIFSALGLTFIPPEIRENMGEIEAAEAGKIPSLIEATDIKGLLHIHSDASDGSDSLETIVDEAKKLGYHYIGISDHSKSAHYAGGLSIEEIRKQHELIDFINKQESSFHIFKGIESEILANGALDYDDNVLETFNFVIAAVHSHFNMTEDEMTDRIIKALDNPFTTVLAHPTGRLLLAREPYRVNIEKIINHAAARGTVLELNANPYRLDLDWRFCRKATQRGVKFAINTDAHNIMGLQHIRYGINIARKGWLQKTDCINCLSISEIKNFFSQRNRQS